MHHDPLALILIFISIVQSGQPDKYQQNCPRECQTLSCSSGRVVCIEPNQLLSLPGNVPKNTHEIIVSRQIFSNATLTYHNLSKYGPEQISLRALQITFTNIKGIEPETFSHLISLKSLDLSNNYLEVIEDGTFKGLSLDSLILDNNRNLVLRDKSLGGLVVSSLSMRNCLIKTLSYDVIKEVSGHLIKLSLSNNQLKTLDQRFELLFRRLDLIELKSNPFTCTCQTAWLMKILQNKETQPEKDQPRCTAPSQLKGRSLASLTDSNFLCTPPSVKELDIYLYGNNSGLLFCEAVNDAESYVKWRHKIFTLQRFYRFFDYSQSIGKSMISIKSNSSLDHYTCFIHNNKGKVHVDVNIMWPIFQQTLDSRNSSIVHYLYPDAQEEVLHAVSGNYIERLLMTKHFSLFEMLLSMLGTMLVTGLASSLCFCFLCKRRLLPMSGKLSQPMTDSAVTSEVLVHNMSQFPSYQELKPSQLIDFRTHQILPLVGSQSNWSLKI